MPYSKNCTHLVKVIENATWTMPFFIFFLFLFCVYNVEIHWSCEMLLWIHLNSWKKKNKEMQHQDCDQENCKSSKLYLYLYLDAIISFAMFFDYISPYFVCGQYNDFPHVWYLNVFIANKRFFYWVCERFLRQF